jgi:hypothetical protein
MKLVKLQNLVAKAWKPEGLYSIYKWKPGHSATEKTVTLNEVIVDCQGVLLDRFGGKSNLLSDNYRFVA